MRRPRPLTVLTLAATLSTAWGCARADSGTWPDPGSAPGGAPSLPQPASTGGTSGHAGESGTGGTGLTSGEFGSEEPDPESPERCEPLATPTCDWSRVDGCCQERACTRASGADVFNLYPVESCQDLIACVQAHPGCSTPEDPLCFQDEAPDAPCLREGYQASHEDPDGPFAWAAELVRCVCGL